MVVRRTLTLLALSSALAVTGGIVLRAPADAAPAPGSVPVTVDISPTTPVAAGIPDRFFGLSLESRQLPTTRTDATTGNLAGLLRSVGPGVLRFGGSSVDTQFFQESPSEPIPTWAERPVLTTAGLDRLAGLARASGWQVILGLNLAQYGQKGYDGPAKAARLALAARQRLGADLIAVEVGNEPNLYPRGGFRPAGWGPADYQQEFLVYKSAVLQAVPGLPVTGPSDYPPYLLGGVDPGRDVPGTFLSQHIYPLSKCADGPGGPDIKALLSPQTMGYVDGQIAVGTGVAAALGLPVRITESNNVICSGADGVSNTFASALWAADYLTLAAQRGVAGVNLHGGLGVCTEHPGSPYYTPLCALDRPSLDGNSYTAQPEFYGIQLARMLTGSFVRVGLHTTTNLVVRATRADDGTVKVLLIDKDVDGQPDLSVTMALPPGYDGGQVTRLFAPSNAAQSGVTLGGATVAPDGSLAPGFSTLAGKGGRTDIAMRAGSAAIVTLAPRCTVPRLKGLTVDAARARLSTGGCNPGIIAKPRGVVAKGAKLVVAKQRLPAGFRYRWHQVVHLQLVAVLPPAKKPAPPTTR